MHVMSSINQCMSCHQPTNACHQPTNACHVINQPMHVINQPMHVINQPMHVMLSVNQCMSCSWPSTDCHNYSQSTKRCPGGTLCKPEGDRLRNNFEFPVQTVWSGNWALMGCSKYAHSQSCYTGCLGQVILWSFFLYRFLKGHYERWWSPLTCIERTVFLPAACGSHRSEGRTVWPPCNTKIWTIINIK